MSNLTADAEDLLERIQASALPEVQELGERLEASVSKMKRQFRTRLKGAASNADHFDDERAPRLDWNRAALVAAGAAMIVTAVALVAYSRRRT